MLFVSDTGPGDEVDWVGGALIHRLGGVLWLDRLELDQADRHETLQWVFLSMGMASNGEF